MTKRASLTTMLALTATLITAPLTPALAQDAAQRGVLSGTTGNLAWTLYGPGQLTGFSGDPQGTLRVSAPQNARIVGAKYEDQTAILAFRSDANVRSVYQQHDRELTQQGFQRTQQTVSDREARATYQRNGTRVELLVQRQDNNVYRTSLDLRGATSARATPAQGAQGSSNQAANQPPATTAQSGSANQNNTRNDVLSVLEGRDDLSMFRQAVDRANLTNRLRGSSSLTEDITVFAPTNAAFQALPSDQRDALLNNAGALYAVISYHMAGGKATAQRLAERRTITTLEGSGYQVTGSGNQLRIGEASVVQANVDASNGVVHVIDRVLIPEDVNLAELARRNQPGNQASGANTPSNQQNSNASTGNQGSAATTGVPIFGYTNQGLRYDYFGARGVTNPTRDANRVNIAVPDSAVDVKQPTRRGDETTVQFESPQELRDVFEFYDRQFRQQGFEQVAGRLEENQTKIVAVYRRDNAQVALSVEREGGTESNKNYEVMIDHTP